MADIERRRGAAPIGAAAALVGASLGAGTLAGSALLLYTGQGFLATAGFLVAVSIAAVCAGLWVGLSDGPSRQAPRSARRWVWVVAAFAAAGAFAWAWTGQARLRETALGGALAVLLILAEPAYASGSLVAALNRRLRDPRGGAAAVPVLAGLAFGVMLAATVLIPSLEPQRIYFGAAVLLAVTGMVEASRPLNRGKDPHSMHGKVVIVTGVADAGQVGYAVARRLLEAGARVVVSGRGEAVEQRARELEAHGAVAAARADLSDAAQAARVVDTARDRYGRVDALINVAGGLSLIRRISETEPDEWDAELRRNARTALVMSRAALPLLRENGGAIVNFAAPAALRAKAKLGAYSAAKAAVVALTRALALEEKPNGVRANAIAPGMIDTTQNRGDVADAETVGWVTREEIAEVALFLASPASAGISGETIHVLGDSLE